MKKYDMLYQPLVERIFAENAQKKDPLKAAKTQMHKMYGAYMQGKSYKKARELLDSSSFDRGINEQILSLHSSTKERISHIAQFYEFIGKHTGAVDTLLDLGCGYNPFALSLMPFSPHTYYAYDIDLHTKDLLNRFFELSGLPQTAKCADLAIENPSENVDLALMLKLVPVLEAQKSGRGYELANSLNSRFLVISYPLKSLGGREKGMEKNYAASFNHAIVSGALSRFSLVASQKIVNEMVYILVCA
ncbi:MAG: hypothetical protein FWF78_07340 [Defluviitaleaceae bacterium]|nr:hypothetical protein [Defluviitaleaceae bacterium]